MVQPTGGYLRESGTVRPFSSQGKKPDTHKISAEKDPAANVELPSVRMNALRRAMASADLRLAIEDMDGREADSFEQRLEAELGKSSTGEFDSEQDERKIEKVSVELDKACREIAKEAQVNLRISQLMRERDRELRRVAPANPAVNAAPKVETVEEPPFKSAVTARRLLFAGAIGAILVGGWTASNMPVANLIERHLGGIGGGDMPAIAATRTEDFERFSEPSMASAAEGVTIEQKKAAGNWEANIDDRLGPNTVEAQKPEFAAAAPKAAVPVAKEVRIIRSNVRHPDANNLSRMTAVAPQPVRVEEKVAPAAATVEEQMPAVEVPAATAKAKSPENQSRQAEMVEIAIGTSRGLDELDGTQRASLKEKLVAGECLSTALGSVFDKVPVLAMRDLIRQLDGAC